MRFAIKALLISGVALMFFNACGHLKKQMVSDEDYLKKVSRATGIATEDLKLDKKSINSGMTEVEFDVYDKRGNKYQCYFTTSTIVDSDALCTKMNKKGKASPANKGNCNELLRKAGKC